MTNSKLPEWRKALNTAVENYQSAQAWYEENQDSSSAEQDVDAAVCEIGELLGKYGILIVLNLLDEIADLQERRKAEAPAPVMVAECAICGKSCTNANHPVKAVTIESPLNTSERAELHAFRRAACNHGFPPGAHTQGVIGCVKCSGRLVMMWEQPNGGDCES